MVLRTCAAAACGLRCLVAEGFGGVETHGILVAGLVVLGVERTDNLVVEHTLVVVHIACVVGIVAVEIAREFQ